MRIFAKHIGLISLVSLLEHGSNAIDSTCVWTERQLRNAIATAAQSSNVTRTRITICRSTILVSNKTNSFSESGIDISNRFIDLRCKFKPSDGACTLDGKGLSRIFYGMGSNLMVKNVKFVNAKPCDGVGNGGALFLGGSSRVTLTGCSFINNGRTSDDTGCLGLNADTSGGAIYVSDSSSLVINGGSISRPVLFSNNRANEYGAVSFSGSNLTVDGYTVFSNNYAFHSGAVGLLAPFSSLKNVVFESNNAKEATGALDIAYGEVFMENVKFQKNSANTSVAMSTDESVVRMINVDFTQNFSDNDDAEVAYFYMSAIYFTNCSFMKNTIAVLAPKLSQVMITNSTFSNNKSTKNLGSDIFIIDNFDPSRGASLVKCLSNTVFCNGLGQSRIYDERNPTFVNTDCTTKGVKGTPGVGTCPI